MTDLFEPSLDDAIGELRAELGRRGRFYGGFIQRGKLTADEADRRVACLKKAIAELEIRRSEQIAVRSHGA